jgi:hypothetical protein
LADIGDDFTGAVSSRLHVGTLLATSTDTGEADPLWVVM